MAYLLKPDANDRMSISQADIKGNFTDIKTLIGVDHEDFDAGAPQGKHQSVRFTKQAASVATAVDEVALYCKDNAAGDPSLFFRPENNGAEVDFTTCNAAATGWCKLPNGIEMKWGSGSLNNGSASVPVGFATAFAGAPYTVQVTGTSVATNQASDGIIYATGIGAAGFSVSRSAHFQGSTISFRWLAIGK